MGIPWEDRWKQDGQMSWGHPGPRGDRLHPLFPHPHSRTHRIRHPPPPCGRFSRSLIPPLPQLNPTFMHTHPAEWPSGPEALLLGTEGHMQKGQGYWGAVNLRP